jgi:PERQ amino acid-rich with GYF domain-containing protein
VLGGFGGSQTATPAQPPVSEADESPAPAEAPHTAPVTGGWRERLAAKQGVKKDGDEAGQPGANAGPGWTNTPNKWRTNTGGSELSSPLDVPRSHGPTTASVIATPSATPVPDRDATVEVAPEPENQDANIQQEGQTEDMEKTEWFYRDPQGTEHGE